MKKHFATILILFVVQAPALLAEENLHLEADRLSSAGDLEKLKSIIDMGLDVNLQSKGGFTLLSSAVTSKQHKVINYLLSKGANPNLVPENGISPLLVATMQNDLPSVAQLLSASATTAQENKDGWFPLIAAAEKPMIGLLLAYGTDPNQKHKATGRSRLHVAAKEGDLKKILLLVSFGADLKLKDNDGRSSLDYVKDQKVRELLSELAAQK